MRLLHRSFPSPPFTSSLSSSPIMAERCNAVTIKGEQCRFKARDGEYCQKHINMLNSPNTPMTATKSSRLPRSSGKARQPPPQSRSVFPEDEDGERSTRQSKKPVAPAQDTPARDNEDVEMEMRDPSEEDPTATNPLPVEAQRPRNRTSKQVSKTTSSIQRYLRSMDSDPALDPDYFLGSNSSTASVSNGNVVPAPSKPSRAASRVSAMPHGIPAANARPATADAGTQPPSPASHRARSTPQAGPSEPRECRLARAGRRAAPTLRERFGSQAHAHAHEQPDAPTTRSRAQRTRILPSPAVVAPDADERATTQAACRHPLPAAAAAAPRSDHTRTRITRTRMPVLKNKNTWPSPLRPSSVGARRGWSWPKFAAGCSS